MNIPPYDPQYSPITDSDSCSAQGSTHDLEMEQGCIQRWSPRGGAKLGGVNPQTGGSIEEIVDAWNNYGLIAYDLWPDLTGNWTLDEYYAPIPQEVLSQANKSYSISIAPWDGTYPCIIEVQVTPKMSHLMAQPYPDYCFDSYPPALKPLSTWQSSAIIGRWKLKIKQKTMLLGYKVSDPVNAGDETVYIQVGNSMIPVADWQAFLNLGGSQNSIVSITQAQLNGVSVVYGDLFKTNA